MGQDFVYSKSASTLEVDALFEYQNYIGWEKRASTLDVDALFSLKELFGVSKKRINAWS